MAHYLILVIFLLLYPHQNLKTSSRRQAVHVHHLFVRQVHNALITDPILVGNKDFRTSL